ncbi:MAG TPA: hypothetical protein VFS12_16970 [Terriglobia bacterium]|nr:hypothetical protein [Terriglobia bacterium]
MIDFDALLRRAERELTDDEALVRTVKTGILFGTLATAMQHYTKIQFCNADVLALLETLAKYGKLYDGLQLSDLRSRLALTSDSARVASVQNGHSPLPEMQGDNNKTGTLSPAEIFAQDNVRQALKEAYPNFTDEEINAIVEAQQKAADPNVIARTDADLAAYEAEQKNPFPGAPRGIPLNDFTMTDNVDVPSDLKPAE